MQVNIDKETVEPNRISANKVVQRKLRPILYSLKISRCGFHALRHTHSSLLIDLGAPLTVAQEQLRRIDLLGGQH